MRAWLESFLNRLWYSKKTSCVFLLAPFSYLFRFFVFLRRSLYRCFVFKVYHFPVPVIVVGNITVGGSGKTPVVIALARALQERGYQPGIVTRGYGGSIVEPTLVLTNDSAASVGDEALLLAKKLKVPVVVGRDRAKAVSFLLKQQFCDLVISDDGLQHYALGRAIEIAVLDGERRVGNGLCLPAGPLREPVRRLRSVNYILVNGDGLRGEWSCKTVLSETVYSLADAAVSIPLSQLTPRRVHAVAGIGYPERFFKALNSQGFVVIPRVFPDHHAYTREDFLFEKSLPIIMTEKDAVKCSSFGLKNAWVLAIEAQLPEGFVDAIVKKL